MEALGGQLDFLRGSLNLPLRVNRVGHYILGAVDFRKDQSRNAPKYPEASASFTCVAYKYPNLSSGGPHLPYTPDGLYSFETPLTFAACEAVTLGDATNGSLAAPRSL